MSGMVRFKAYSGCDCRLPGGAAGNQGGYHECRLLSSIFAALRLGQMGRGGEGRSAQASPCHAAFPPWLLFEKSPLARWDDGRPSDRASKLNYMRPCGRPSGIFWFRPLRLLGKWWRPPALAPVVFAATSRLRASSRHTGAVLPPWSQVFGGNPRSNRHASDHSEAPVPPPQITVMTGGPAGGTALLCGSGRGWG
jgi:hypothetical protein